MLRRRLPKFNLLKEYRLFYLLQDRYRFREVLGLIFNLLFFNSFLFQYRIWCFWGRLWGYSGLRYYRQLLRQFKNSLYPICNLLQLMGYLPFRYYYRIICLRSIYPSSHPFKRLWNNLSGNLYLLQLNNWTRNIVRPLFNLSLLYLLCFLHEFPKSFCHLLKKLFIVRKYCGCWRIGRGSRLILVYGLLNFRFYSLYRLNCFLLRYVD